MNRPSDTCGRGFDSMAFVENQSHPLESQEGPQGRKFSSNGLVVDNVKDCAETTERLVKTGGRLVRHATTGPCRCRRAEGGRAHGARLAKTEYTNGTGVREMPKNQAVSGQFDLDAILLTVWGA